VISDGLTGGVRGDTLWAHTDTAGHAYISVIAETEEGG
jgi:hypothetical protein